MNRFDGPHPLFLRLIADPRADVARLVGLIGSKPDGAFTLSNLDLARLFGWNQPDPEEGQRRASKAVAGLIEAGGALRFDDRPGFFAHLRDVTLSLDPARDRAAKAKLEQQLRRDEAGRYLLPLWWTPFP